MPKPQTTAIDGWTLAHLAVGAGMALLGLPRPFAYGVAIGTEVVEGSLREKSEFFQESRANIATDVAASVGSYELVRLLMK